MTIRLLIQQVKKILEKRMIKLENVVTTCALLRAIWFADHGHSYLFLCPLSVNVRCLLLQGLSLLLAMILKAIGPHPYYDSDDDYVPERVPLLKNAVLPPPYVVGDPVYGSKSDSWTIRINDKVEMLFFEWPMLYICGIISTFLNE